MENGENTVKVVIAGREVEIDSYKLPEIIVITGDPHAADLNPFLIIERGTRGGIPLPGGHFDFDDHIDRDAYNRAEDERVEASLAEALRALHQERLDRLDTNYVIPISFDTSGSMPDETLRAMVAEVHSIMGDIFLPMEMSPREIEDRMFAMLRSPSARETREMRLEYDAMMVAKKMHADLPYFERNPSHGAPRSIKETRRAQGRGKQASAMRGRGKRK